MLIKICLKVHDEVVLINIVQIRKSVVTSRRFYSSSILSLIASSMKLSPLLK